MAGHVRQGRRYLSPVAATVPLTIGDWVRDDLPDLIWPILVLAESGTASGRKFIDWQKRVQDDLKDEVSPQSLADGLDGRLTSLDRLIEGVPSAADVIRRHTAELGLLTATTASVLASYPDGPAQWFASLPFEPINQAGIELLAEAIRQVLADGHREAVVKCLGVWSSVQAGTFHSDSATIELLKHYPTDSQTRAVADSAIRAMWGSHRLFLINQDPDRFSASIQWAKVFWGINSMTSNCIRGSQRRAESSVEGSDGPESLDVQACSDPPGDGPEESASGVPPTDSTALMPPGTEHFRRFAMDLLSSYFEALETSPSRLYDVELHEVNTGLVTRAGREVIAALGAPDSWGLENGSHVIRVLVETRIYVEWMTRQDQSIYVAYKRYGQGKAKLYARISEELRTKGAFPGLDEAIGEFRKLGHDDDVLEHRIVDTNDSFSGKSIRTMAEECGLLEMYRHAYYVASGVSHSEWWSIETHCMEQCRNILHRGHLIPSLSLPEKGNGPMAKSWLDALYGLIWRSLEIQRADPKVVDEAFEWLRSDPDGSSES